MAPVTSLSVVELVLAVVTVCPCEPPDPVLEATVVAPAFPVLAATVVAPDPPEVPDPVL